MILNNWNLPTLHWYSVTVNILSFFACLSSFTLEAGNQFKSIRHVWCLLFLPCFKRTQFCFGNKTLQNNQKHTHQITNTHTDAPKRRHALTHSLTQLSCKVTWWKGQKAVSPFTFHARLKLLSQQQQQVIASGYWWHFIACLSHSSNIPPPPLTCAHHWGFKEIFSRSLPTKIGFTILLLFSKILKTVHLSVQNLSTALFCFLKKWSASSPELMKWMTRRPRVHKKRKKKKRKSGARTSGCPAIRPISPCSNSIWNKDFYI